MSVNRTSAPLGIKIICLLGAIGVVLGILGGLGMMALGDVGILLGPIVVVLSLVQAVTIYGLWTLQSWGWTLAMVVYGLDFLLDVANLLMGSLGAIFGLALSGLILAYIYSKRDHYRSSERNVPEANTF